MVTFPSHLSYPPLPSSFHDSSQYCQLVLTSTCGTSQYCLISTHQFLQTDASPKKQLYSLYKQVTINALQTDARYSPYYQLFIPLQ